MIINFLFVLSILYLAAGAGATLWNRDLKSKGLKGIPYKDCWSPKKFLSVGLGFFLSIIPQHVFEQFVIRVYDDYCRPNCLKGNGGKCDECGCHTYAKMMSPFEEDSRANWGKIIWNKQKYQEIRSKRPVKINIEYGHK